MNANIERDNALREQGEVGNAINLNPKRTKKIDRVIAGLKLPQRWL